MLKLFTIIGTVLVGYTSIYYIAISTLGALLSSVA